MRLATDGEFRRAVLSQLLLRPARRHFVRSARRTKPGRPRRAADGRRSEAASPGKAPIHAADFAFLRARTTALPKITIPGPCALHFRGGDAAVRRTPIATWIEFWDDIVAAFRSELRSLAAAGCSYVQIDETAFAKFGDADVQATLRARGDDPDALIDKYIDDHQPRARATCPDLRIGMHLCRGNRGGQWHAEGSYEAVAEKLFNAARRSVSSSSNTIRRAPAISRRCASCRRTNRSCSASSRPR